MNGVNTPTKLGVIGAGGVGSATAYAAMVLSLIHIYLHGRSLGEQGGTGGRIGEGEQ